MSLQFLFSSSSEEKRRKIVRREITGRRIQQSQGSQEP
jgi:hypothetical protein